MINRRTLLASLAMLSTCGVATAQTAVLAAATKLPIPVNLGEPQPFSKEILIKKAKELSQNTHQVIPQIPKEWVDLSYDQYRGINFDRKSALWNKTESPFQLEFFAPGLYFKTPIRIHVVDDEGSRAVKFSKDVFKIVDLVPDLPVDDTLGYSGFRILANINDPVRMDEFTVFQGASYFRAVAEGQQYGLSARGLALKTGDAEGEEFPEFREFWVESAKPGDSAVTVHALLDSPSVTGIYTFQISPGENTTFDVTATLFPRTELTHVGIGAETSMFLFDETNRSRFDDFREAVHDSDGLLIENGAGETLWRQLSNPNSLQISSFVDNNPKGFGLLQRPRDFADYADLEANYQKRPGLWVVPGEDWGRGAVTLVEIPTDKEIYDNIVAYWRPRKPLAAGSEYTFSYKLFWCDEPPVRKTLARVINTRMGKRVFKEGRVATVDFAPTSALKGDLDDIVIHVSANGGKVSDGILQRNPTTKGVRLAFTFDPGERKSVELRAQLQKEGTTISEVWLYRWTA